VIFEPGDLGAVSIIAVSLPVSLILGLIISTPIYRIGKKNSENYDWRVLWLSVSIIAFVIEVLIQALRVWKVL
jgi:hypothetical protein